MSHDDEGYSTHQVQSLNLSSGQEQVTGQYETDIPVKIISSARVEHVKVSHRFDGIEERESITQTERRAIDIACAGCLHKVHVVSCHLLRAPIIESRRAEGEGYTDGNGAPEVRVARRMYALLTEFVIVEWRSGPHKKSELKS